MPIYEYICEKCGDHTEVMQKITDAPLKKCRKCKGKLEKIVSRTSFSLKGSGWYMTDYPKKSASNEKADADKPEKSKSSSTDAGSPTKTESK